MKKVWQRDLKPVVLGTVVKAEASDGLSRLTHGSDNFGAYDWWILPGVKESGEGVPL